MTVTQRQFARNKRGIGLRPSAQELHYARPEPRGQVRSFSGNSRQRSCSRIHFLNLSLFLPESWNRNHMA